MSAIRQLKRTLNKNISDIAKDPEAFVRNPGKDFSRNRMLTKEEIIRFIVSMGGQSINKELYSYSHTNDKEAPSASAFTQQRQKLLPEAFYELMRRFNHDTESMNRKESKWHGCRLLAVDGTDINLPYNPDSATFMSNQDRKGYNQIHCTALYDITNRVYLDAVLEPKTAYNESRASGVMVSRTLSGGSNIVIGDRGTVSMNLIKTLLNHNISFLFRVKTDWTREIAELPLQNIDRSVVLHIATSVPMYRKLRRKHKNVHLLAGKSRYGKDKYVAWDYDDGAVLGFRIVRFQLPNGTWETLVTNLNSAAFGVMSVKELYHLRWGIESSFRDLKYSIGLASLHARNEESIKQEIFAALLAYNFAERAISMVIVEQGDTKYEYHVAFSDASYVIRVFLRTTTDPPGILEDQLARYRTPYRPGRYDKRKMKPKTFYPFIYRVA